MELFSEAAVPDSVADEVVLAGIRVGAPEAAGIEGLFENGRLRRVSARRSSLGRRLEGNPRLSRADRDSLVLAHATGARILADDAAVRSAAKRLGIPLGGTLFVLVRLVEERRVEPQAGVAYLDRLIDEGWFCSPTLYRAARDAITR